MGLAVEDAQFYPNGGTSVPMESYEKLVEGALKLLDSKQFIHWVAQDGYCAK
jgi:hypothetical protein